MLFVCRHHKFQ